MYIMVYTSFYEFVIICHFFIHCLAGRPPGTATRLTTGMAGARQPVTGGGVGKCHAHIHTLQSHTLQAHKS